MESGDTEQNRVDQHRNAKRSYTNWYAAQKDFIASAQIRAQYKMAYNREEIQWAWLFVVLSNDFLVKGTAPAKKKPICAEMTVNT